MKKKISIITMIALGLGIVFGLMFKDAVPYIKFAGDWYVKLLKVTITPVIFTSIASTIYATSKKKDRMVLKSVALFTVMFIVTFLITSLLVWLIDPSKGFVFDETAWEKSALDFTSVNVLDSILPKSLKDIFVNPKVFFVIVVAWVFGKLMSFFNVDKLFDGINKVKTFLYKILEYITYVTPIAVFSLIANTAANNGSILLGVGLRYIATAWFCSVVAMILVMIIPGAYFAKIKPLEYIKKVNRIWLMTITTRSSAATLPYTVKTCKDEFGIKDSTTDIVVPLGCTIHMCGGAVSFALLGLFTAKMYGIEVTFVNYILMIVSSLLINMAAPGIPGGGVVIGASYLQIFSIPLSFIGFYSGIYTLLDMIYTTLNVTGDITANIILDREK